MNDVIDDLFNIISDLKSRLLTLQTIAETQKEKLEDLDSRIKSLEIWEQNQSCL